MPTIFKQLHWTKTLSCMDAYNELVWALNWVVVIRGLNWTTRHQKKFNESARATNSWLLASSGQKKNSTARIFSPSRWYYDLYHFSVVRSDKATDQEKTNTFLLFNVHWFIFIIQQQFVPTWNVKCIFLPICIPNIDAKRDFPRMFRSKGRWKHLSQSHAQFTLRTVPSFPHFRLHCRYICLKHHVRNASAGGLRAWAFWISVVAISGNNIVPDGELARRLHGWTPTTASTSSQPLRTSGRCSFKLRRESKPESKQPIAVQIKEGVMTESHVYLWLDPDLRRTQCSWAL
jgi:hypothetical protein